MWQTDRRTENTIHRAAWSQLKRWIRFLYISSFRFLWVFGLLASAPINHWPIVYRQACACKCPSSVDRQFSSYGIAWPLIDTPPGRWISFCQPRDEHKTIDWLHIGWGCDPKRNTEYLYCKHLFVCSNTSSMSLCSPTQIQIEFKILNRLDTFVWPISVRISLFFKRTGLNVIHRANQTYITQLIMESSLPCMYVVVYKRVMGQVLWT